MSKPHFQPSIGDTVSVCYDGKLSRAVDGTMLVSTLHRIRVRFTPWAEECDPVELDFEREDRKRFAGWLIGEGEGGIMRALGCDGDFYSVVKKKFKL